LRPVGVGGVDEVHPLLDGGTHHCACPVGVGGLTPDAVPGDPHGALAQRGRRARVLDVERSGCVHTHTSTLGAGWHPCRARHRIVPWAQASMPEAPSQEPTANVAASASAPPMTTRRAARSGSARPIQAPTAPVIASATSTATNVTGTRMLAGGSRIASIGSTDPARKATAEASAACQGLTTSSSSTPRARWESVWLETDTYSPSAIEIAPPSTAASPATRIGPAWLVTPATPTTTAATETIPSLAPSTPARNQLSRLARSSWGSVTWGSVTSFTRMVMAPIQPLFLGTR